MTATLLYNSAQSLAPSVLEPSSPWSARWKEPGRFRTGAGVASSPGKISTQTRWQHSPRLRRTFLTCVKTLASCILDSRKLSTLGTLKSRGLLRGGFKYRRLGASFGLNLGIPYFLAAGGRRAMASSHETGLLNLTTHNEVAMKGLKWSFPGDNGVFKFVFVGLDSAADRFVLLRRRLLFDMGKTINFLFYSASASTV